MAPKQAETLPRTPGLRLLAGGLDLAALCGALAGSGLFEDAPDASRALVKVLYGLELGIPPASAMLGIRVVAGRAALSPTLLAALVQRSEVYGYRVRRHTAAACDLEFFERGESVGHSVWTRAEARRAGLDSAESWRKSPRQALFHRALFEGVRTFCPDLFSGVPLPLLTEKPAAASRPRRTGENTVSPDAGRTPEPTAYTSAEGREARLPPASVTALRAECAALLKALGFPLPARPRAYFEAVLERPIAALSGLTHGDWSELRARLWRAVSRRKAAFAAYAQLCALCGADARNRPLRLESWARLAGRPLETSGELTPREWERLAQTLRERVDAECRRQVEAARGADAAGRVEDPVRD